jgi:hypothetical protein
MPKTEELVPWAATQAASREPYPRKNLYFVGEDMDEVYDYCVWQAHIDGYETLDGKAARGSAGFITDILLRTYLQTMVEPGKTESFSAWRTAEYTVGERTVHPAPPQPELLLIKKSIQRRAEKTIFLPAMGRRVSEAEAEQLFLTEYEARRRKRS